jgi:rSAM/selenodomain-associated transferase 2
VVPLVSVIVPVLDDTAATTCLIRQIPDGPRIDVVIVDGGSDVEIADVAGLRSGTRVIHSTPGRGRQMNAGAAAAAGDVLMFLHCDCVLPDHADRFVLDGLSRSGAAWGRFDVHIEGRHPLLRVVAAMMNIRSRLTGIATGDQAIFVRKDAFERAGHFPDIPLMEDIALSKALKRISPPLCLNAKIRTSGRRWEENGVMHTIVLMWRLRLAYFLGASPAALAKRYGYVVD